MGMISSAGIMKLVNVEGKMDRVKYRAILEENWFQYARDLRPWKKFIFQQDIDRTTKDMLEWLQSKNLNALQVS